MPETIEAKLDDLFAQDISDPEAHEAFRGKLREFVAEINACGSPFDVAGYVDAKIRAAQLKAIEGHPALTALQRDADRYRWLRERDVETIYTGGVFVGKTPENIVLSGIDCDAAVDAARIAEQEPDAGE